MTIDFSLNILHQRPEKYGKTMWTVKQKLETHPEPRECPHKYTGISPVRLFSHLNTLIESSTRPSSEGEPDESP